MSRAKPALTARSAWPGPGFRPFLAVQAYNENRGSARRWGENVVKKKDIGASMAPGGIEPPRAGSKPAALSTELRGRADRSGRPVCPTAARYPVDAEVAVAQLVEPRVVVPVVAGSSPVRHPSTGSTGEHPVNTEYSRPQ